MPAAVASPEKPPREPGHNQTLKSDNNAAQAKKHPTKAAEERVAYGEELTKGRDAEKHGTLAEAREIYQRLISGYPRRFEAYHRLAVVADRQRRYPEAQALYTQAIHLNNRDPDLFNDLGYCFYLQGNFDKAESAYLKAMAMRPAEARYRNNLGLVYGMQGRYEEALAQYRRAGGEGDAYYNLAFVKACRNDAQGAKDCFRSALAADPTHEQARRALAAFECAESHPEDLPQLGSLTEAGITWVPYVENENLITAGQAEASKTAAGSDRAAASPRSATRSLIDKAQAYAAKGNPTASR